MARETPWFQAEDDELAEKAFRVLRKTQDDTGERWRLIQEMERLYAENIFLYPGDPDAIPILSHNVLAGAVDTVVAEVTQVHRRPMFVPRAAGYDLRTKCRKLTYWHDTLLDDNADAVAHAARDSVLCGLGAVHITNGFNGPSIQRIWPGNIHFDDRNCIDTPPRTIQIVRNLDVDYLCAQHPGLEKRILEAPSPDPSYNRSTSTDIENLREVCFSIHLPSTPKAKDGKIVKCLDGILLSEKPWNHDHYSIAFIRPVPPIQGFWGESLARRAKPAQEELNKWMYRVQQSMHLFCVPKVFMRPGAKPPQAMLTNNIGAVIYTDEVPQFFTPQAMPSEVYAQIDRLERMVFSEIGANQMAAQSMKQPGVESGVALRAVADIQSKRFSQLETSVSKASRDIAKYSVEVMKEMVKHDPSLDVVFRSKGRVGTESFKDIDLEENRFHIVISQSNTLPVEPSGKYQMLSEMVRDGVATPVDLWASIDSPDTEDIRVRATAPRDMVLYRLEKMLNTGEYLPPEPYLDIMTAKKVCIETLAENENEGTEDEKLDLLRMWLGDLDTMEEDMQAMLLKKQQEMQAAAAPPQPPPAPQMAPPDQQVPPNVG